MRKVIVVGHLEIVHGYKSWGRTQELPPVSEEFVTEKWVTDKMIVAGQTFTFLRDNFEDATLQSFINDPVTFEPSSARSST